MHNELDRTPVETDAGTYTIISYYEEDGGSFDPLVDYDRTGMELYVYQRGYDGWEVTLSDLDDSEPATVIDYDETEPNGLKTATEPNAARALKHFISKVGAYGDSKPVERHMGKWLALAGNPVIFISGSVASGQSWYNYFALVTNDGDYADPQRAVETTMQEWADWVNGEVYYYQVERPDGTELEDSCGGYIGDAGRQYMIEEATAEAHADAAERIEHSRLAGAGFMGII